MKTIKFEIVYQKEKGDEWKIVSVWGNCWIEIKKEFMKKIGKPLQEVDNYAILNPNGSS